MGSLLQDLHYAVRSFARQPGFTAIVFLTLGLGIGASTAIFTVVNSVLLKPLPYEDSDRLVKVFEQNLERGWAWYSVSPANFLDWREKSSAFEDLAAYSLYSGTGYNLTGDDGEPERIETTAVTQGFFEIFRVQPAQGRTFSAAEDTDGGEKVVVLSHGLWQRRFGADPRILEQFIELDSVPYRVVGVMKPGFSYPGSTDLWLPRAFTQEERNQRTVRTENVVGRLLPNVSPEQGQEQLDAIAQGLEQEYPTSNAGFTIVLFTLYERTVENLRPALLLLLAAVGTLLLIACANVANLLLARASARRTELAVRGALGAGRSRLVRQMLIESLVLGLGGGLLGLVVAWGSVKLLVARAPAHIPRVEEIGIDLRVLLFALLSAVVTSLLFGLAPVAQGFTKNLFETLRSGGRSGAGGGLLRQGVVVVEVAGALVLLVTAGLMIRSFLTVMAVDPGFEPKGVMTLQLSMAESRYPDMRGQAEMVRQLESEVTALPQVEAVGATSWLPLATAQDYTFDFFPEGRPPDSLDDVLTTGFRAVSPDYFQAMGIDKELGRFLTPRDRDGALKVAVINRTMARQYWPDQSPLGARVVVGSLLADSFPNLPLTVEIVGVVQDVSQQGLDRAPGPELFVPLAQYTFPNVYLTARAQSGDAEGLTNPIRNGVRNVDPFQPIYDVQSMEERLAASVSQPRLNMLLLALFAAVALFLAAVGIYGVLSYSVAQRRREMGLRMALGSSRSGVLKLVVLEGLKLALVGLIAGTASALLFARWLSSQLYEVSPFDPFTLGAVVALLALVSFIASVVPALRASRVDPLVALRYD
ncbi:MAG: ABC transporter permease [Acidobacteriota bacterium]